MRDEREVENANNVKKDTVKKVVMTVILVMDTCIMVKRLWR